MIEGVLKSGTTLISQSNVTYEVIKMLGSGGQGEVYEVESPTGRKALKWYYKKTSTPEQKNMIQSLVDAGAPSENFLWPIDFITDNKKHTFGYIMELRPRRFRNIPDYLNRKIELNFKTLLMVVFHLTKEFNLLHQKGYSYKDISEQNVFLDAMTGDVLICDNDNVSINGMTDSGVYGTMRFMAPEIVRGEARPSRNTDLYSLAVLIFNLLYISHPLEGKNEAKIHALDDHANRMLFGTNPVFIFDPENSENRPVEGIHDNAIIYWELYPKFVKDLMIKAFTEGIKYPEKRIVEKIWMDTSIKLLDHIMICPECGAEVFYDEYKEEHHISHVCWNCYHVFELPVQLQIGKQKIILSKRAKITRHHLFHDYQIETIVASVTQNPNNKAQLGLKNESNENWTYIRSDGTQALLAPGRNAAITVGAKINFGTTIGEIIGGK